MIERIKNKISKILGSKRMVDFFKNIMTLITGNGIAMIIEFVSSAILLRMVGLATFGNVTLIVAYVQIIDAIFNFQSWQALIKFGSPCSDNLELMQRYLKEAFIVDFSTAVLGTVVSICFAGIICGTFLKWDIHLVRLAKVYSLTTLFHLEGMAIGYLRIIGKYKSLSICTVVSSFIKLILIIIAYWIRRDIITCVVIYAITDIVIYMGQFFVAVYYMRKNGLLNGIIKREIPDFKAFFSFSTYTSIATTLDIPIKQFDVFIISKVLSVEAVAVQKVFNSLLNVLNKVSTPISQVVFPSFAKQVSNAKFDECIEDVKKISRIILLVGMPSIIVVGFCSPFWLNWLYGSDVSIFWKVFLVEGVFRVISMTFIAIHPLFTAMGFVKANIPIMLISNGIYFLAAIGLGKLWGLYGIAFSYLIQLLIVVVLKSYRIMIYIRKQKQLLQNN